MIYLVKVSLWLGLLWLVYALFLRKENFYRFNRGFLFLCGPLAFLLPLLRYHYTVAIELPPLTGAISGLTQPATTTSALSFWPHLLVWLYVGVALGLLLWQGLAFYKMGRRIGKAQPTAHTRTRRSQDGTGSFSFFNYIILGKTHSDLEEELILHHEAAHVQQAHWIDLACAQFICILQWYNPFAWLYLQSVRQNHEYLADAAVLEQGYAPELYRAALINQQFQAPVLPLGHAFAYQRLKRLSRLACQPSRPLKKAAVLLLLPLAALSAWAFSVPEYVQTPAELSAIRIRGVQMPAQGEADSTRYFFRIFYENHPDSLPTPHRIKQTTVHVRTVGKMTDQPHIVNSVLLDEAKNTPLFVVNGVQVSAEEFRKMGVPNSGIQHISVLKGAEMEKAYGAKAQNGVILISTERAAQ
jgi:Antirepressor regulating drug resistance, predicted signal transduction N-terminal membrane component